ncbi:MAG: 30S ribosomal protein S12 methylthiotransferase RimO [Bacteroidales bacterium]|nr:30S ribosomal protein S12 methylthiotransferase RimO [Bacteroidales bacterium]
MLKLRILTLGCSKNTVDSERIAYLLGSRYNVVPEGECDVLLINTCGFIGDAKEESVNAILEAVEARKAGEISKLVVFGCLSQRYRSELEKEIPEVDAYYGTNDYDDLLAYLGIRGEFDECTSRMLSESGHYAYLKISEGCNRNCAYCAIPGIRGRHRSRTIESLVEETKLLAAKGVRELNVIAQDITYYGLDIYHKRALAELIRALSEVDGIEWIRLHYSYPAAFPDNVLKEIAQNPKVCKYMDIPLQHINDDVLTLMRRGSTGEQIRSLISKFRTMVPGIVLRTTLIVGHPGETRKAFNELIAFVKEAGIQRLGAFTYSEEDGTYGARHYADTISEKTKSRRLDALMEVQKEVSLDFNLSRVGSIEKVIVDGISGEFLVCRSQWESPGVDGEIFVRMEGVEDPYSLVGGFIEVRVTSADEYDLYAEKLN